jgi:hypothetical protein
MLTVDRTQELLNRWTAWGQRQALRQVLASPSPPGLAEFRAKAGKDLTALESATALDALAASTELVKHLKDLQWLVVKSAREDGATWEQIGEVLGTSKQGAQLAYRRAVDALEQATSTPVAGSVWALLGPDEEVSQ